jgi:deoxyribodipyrimidine photo-lyase
MEEIAVFWFRRDLRIKDNTALFHALQSGLQVLPLFIFDEAILNDLPKKDARVQFIHQKLEEISREFQSHQSALLCKKGNVEQVWQELLASYNIRSAYWNKDYEPYAIERDIRITDLLHHHGIKSYSYKDQVIFEENEVLKKDGKAYSVFTPYKNRWLQEMASTSLTELQADLGKLVKHQAEIPTIEALGFQKSNLVVKEYRLNVAQDYEEKRDFPALDHGSYLGPHLRFGTVSIRSILRQLEKAHSVFLNELIWREFFMQILFHFPHVVKQSFRKKYDQIPWKNNEDDFLRWKDGRTGYPLVDAGMRQLNQIGYMHNRVRMLTASFLCKHLLIDWRWGEAYFAEKLLDFELASNNGNWQWAAGTGCDAAPYFRIFNPITQQKKFDPQERYIRKWIPEYDTPACPKPMIDHQYARERALYTYKSALDK